MITAADHHHMARALQLAARGLHTTDPNPRVGCVLVRDGQVVGEGWHQRAGDGHAEYIALQAAGSRARGSTAYITLEPCCHHGRTPPCTDALIAAGVARVVAAMQDPNVRVAGGGLAQLRAAGIQVHCGLLETEARALNPGFIRRMESGRPYFRLKLAMSLDGRTALESGESRWITGEAARLDVQQWRARSSAILTGANTVLADDPSLNVRLPDTRRQPLRVILDPRLRTPPQARLLDLPGEVLILSASEDPRRIARLRERGASVARVDSDHQGLDLAAVARELARREMNEVHVECGATLAGAFLEARLLDELVVYLAPSVLGDSARGLFRLAPLGGMRERIEFHIAGIRAVGQDWRIIAHPQVLSRGTNAVSSR